MKALQKHLFVLMFSTLLLTLPLLFPLQASAMTAQVVADRLNVRAEPSLSSPVIAQILHNEVYTITDQQEDWVQLQLTDGKIGWAYRIYLAIEQPQAEGLPSLQGETAGVDHSTAGETKPVEEIVQEASTLLASPTVTNLHVRTGPGTSFPSYGLIQPEEAFPILQEQGEWLQIQYTETETGWVAGWLVQKQAGEVNRPANLGNEAVINAQFLNVRAEPSTSAPILDQLQQGKKVQIEKVADGWYYVIWETEGMGQQEGWIASEYAEVNESTKVQSASTENGMAQGERDPLASSKDDAHVRVMVDRLFVRYTPTQDGEILEQVTQSTLLPVLKREGDWIQVALADGQSGWVASWYVEDAEQKFQNPPTVTILTDGTNLRSGPGMEYEVVQRGTIGEKYPVIGQEDDWFKLQLNEGEQAYVAGWVVGISGLPPVDRATQQMALQGKVIVIDAGHGGKDQGAKGTTYGTLEKAVNLNVALRVTEKLQAAGANVITTRYDDTYLSLQERVNVAIRQRADAFVSIHHNTIADPRITGTIVYYYSRSGKERSLANTLVQEIVNQTQFINKGARHGNYFVLRENPQLAVLIELGFLTNPEEERLINTETYLEKAAEGIFQGITKYFAYHSR